MVLLLASLITSAHSTNCDVFPKIFGGSSGSTYLNHIDVFNDYLALAGYTNDKSISISTYNYPYVALTSISTAGKYYWGKVLQQKQNQDCTAVKFSTDGALLIAHCNSFIGSSIVIFNIAGNILSARLYSDGGLSNYNYLVRSMAISSSPTPMAYVLSNFQQLIGDKVSCTGQRLIKFDPLTFSATPVWSKFVNQCGHLGLTFGRSQVLFYSFSWFNRRSTVSLLDTAGNSKWQCVTPDGNSTLNNFIEYKQINSATDMILATSGFNYINYNRIVSSSSSPYSIIKSETNTFRDNRASTSRQIRALYIIDINNAVSLIFENTTQTDLAIINFLQKTVTYKKTFPTMHSLRSAIFISPSIYYAGTQYFHYYSNQTKIPIYLYKKFSLRYQSIVYSSDISLTSCYQMAKNQFLIPIQMTSLAITQIFNQIYFSSNEVFKEDFAVSIVFDINKKNLTKANFCNLYPFQINTVTQTTTFHTFQQGPTPQIIPITLFSATVRCGIQLSTWTYSGVSALDGHTINLASDQMSVDPTTGQILVSQTKPVGTYKIKVIGTLPDLSSTSELFTIIIAPLTAPNLAPTFQTSIPDLLVPLKQTKTYTFPTIYDFNSDPTKISVVKDSLSGPLPSFITISGSTLTITPTLMAHVKVYTMVVTITDNTNYNNYEFFVNVTNQPPTVTSPVQSPVVLTFGQELIYDLPSSMDPEGLPYATTIESGPSYVSLISSQTQLRIKPKNCATDFGTKTVTMLLEDEEPANIIYSIELQVTNLPPIFQGTAYPEVQNIMMNTIFNQTLPSFSDPEGCPLEYTFDPVKIQSFIQIIDNQIIYSPTQLYQSGNHNATLTCTDVQGLSVNITFGLNIYQPPKLTQSLDRTIELFASNQANYSLPVIESLFNNYSIRYISLPRYVSYNTPSFNFLPDKTIDLGLSIIQGSLSNPQQIIKFTLKLNVTNQAPHITENIPDQVIPINSKVSYLIPEVIDREGQSISYKAHEVGEPTLPQFVKFIRGTKEFQFEPTQLDPIKVYEIQLDLQDSFGASSSSTFTVTIFDPSMMNSSTILGNLSPQWLDVLKKTPADISTQVLTMEIVKVTRDHKASLKINSGNQSRTFISEIMVQLTNQTIEVTVQQQNSIEYKIAFQILNKDFRNSIIELSLKYPNPSNLSISQEPDLLKIKTINRTKTLKQKVQTILPENILCEASIPAQLTSSFEQNILNSFQGGRISLTENTPINLIIGFIIQILWSQLEDISFLAINSMIAIVIPGIPSIIQSVMIKYMYFDILYTELWMSQFMATIGVDFDNVDNDEALNVQFFENGYESKQFLKNSGSSVFYLGVYILMWFIYSWITFVSQCSENLNSLQKYMKRQLKWNLSFNLLMSQFSPLFLCSLLNLYDLRFMSGQNLSEFSTYISLLVLVAISAVLMSVLINVWRETRQLNQEQIEKINNKYSYLTESLKDAGSQRMIYFWKPLYLVRWALTLGILIVLQDKPSFQILSLLLLSILQQALLLLYRPFNSRAVNMLSFYNEASVSIYLYLAFLLSDYLDSQFPEEDGQATVASLRLLIAWILTSLLMFTIFINFIYAVYRVSGSARRYIKRKVTCKRKTKPDQINMEHESVYEIQNLQKFIFEKADNTRVIDFDNLEEEDKQQPQLVQKLERHRNQDQFPFEIEKSLNY